ncbi:MAG: hypothetical protein K6G38_00170 [Gammaproteobacteria bacterium]|nr:hypothetical protein [Gammaproteobacteria bacterium]
MVSEYIKDIKLLAEHSDYNRKLRLNSLMHFFQEASIAHTEELGMGREKTLDKGFLWIISTERFKINRLPSYDEKIKIVSYPGKTMHFFFPRYFNIYDERGELIIEGSSIWSLIDINSREFIDPEENGITINGEEKGTEIANVLRIPLPKLNNSKREIVNFKDADLNGHLNNASYVDKCLDIIDNEYLINHEIKEVVLNFKKEIKLNDEFIINYEKVDDNYYFANDNFSLKLSFK